MFLRQYLAVDKHAAEEWHEDVRQALCTQQAAVLEAREVQGFVVQEVHLQTAEAALDKVASEREERHQ